MSGWRTSLFLVCATLLGCAKPDASDASATPPQILRLSQRNEPSDLDPATSSLPDDFFIIRALSEGLLVPGGEGGPPQPAAAVRWDVSADGLTYTFHLRTAKWSNGEAVTAGDFVASYQRLLTPATAAPKAHLFFAVKNARAFASGSLRDFSSVGFRATDASTLVITLEQAVLRFPHYVASGPWIPVNPRVVARHGRQWTRPENFVGNGAFTLVEWRPRQRIVVKKNPGYHASAQTALAEIHFISFDNGDTEERAYRAGQIDVTMAVPASKLEVYARERPAELHRTPLAETRYLSFNTRRPPLDDIRVRRALALAIDREKIVGRVTRGGQEAAFRFVPPTLFGPDENNPPPWAARFDPAEARQLLAAAGFPEGKTFPRLELTGWANTPVLEALQAMWRQELGIEVGIAMREAKVHVAALAAGEYDIGFITQIPDVADPLDLLADFASGAPGNYPQWSDARYDALLEETGRSSDQARQGALLIAAEGRLIESGAVAPLYFNAKNWLMSPRVRGWKEDALWNRNYGWVSLAEK